MIQKLFWALRNHNVFYVPLSAQDLVCTVCRRFAVVPVGILSRIKKMITQHLKLPKSHGVILMLTSVSTTLKKKRPVCFGCLSTIGHQKIYNVGHHNLRHVLHFIIFFTQSNH